MNIKSLLLLLVIVTLVSCHKKEVEIPLPEHPRPNFERAVWQNLNGYWYFKTDSTNVGLEENWQDTPGMFNQKILVPFSWASPLSEIQRPKVNVGWYYQSVEVKEPVLWEGKDIYLVFCASDFNTTVWINGTKVGQHSGGYVPFDFKFRS